jgi:hypothetical protein
MKLYLDADPLMINPNNDIVDEIQQGIMAGSSRMLNHDIYFAESVTISKVVDDVATPLVLGDDYEFVELDDIATELTEKECYRKIKFFANHYVIKVSYHVYGDFLRATDINTIVQEIELIKDTMESDSSKDRMVINGNGSATSFTITGLPSTARHFEFKLNSIPLEEVDYSWTFTGTSGNLIINGFVPLTEDAIEIYFRS